MRRSASVEHSIEIDGECSHRHAEEKVEIQRRYSSCCQFPPRGGGG